MTCITPRSPTPSAEGKGHGGHRPSITGEACHAQTTIPAKRGRALSAGDGLGSGPTHGGAESVATRAPRPSCGSVMAFRSALGPVATSSRRAVAEGGIAPGGVSDLAGGGGLHRGGHAVTQSLL